jgi:hypothetical protein
MILNTHQLRVIRNLVMRDGLRKDHPLATDGPIVQMNQIELSWIDMELDRMEITRKIEAYRNSGK